AALGPQVQKLAGASAGDMRKKLAELQKSIDVIEGEFKSSRTISFAEAAETSVRMTSESYQNYGRVRPGIRPGISELTEMVGPIMSPSIVTLLAPSGHGKTGLITQILKAAGTKDTTWTPAPSLFMSLEMGAVDIARRILAGDTLISTTRQRAGEIEAS